MRTIWTLVKLPFQTLGVLVSWTGAVAALGVLGLITILLFLLGGNPERRHK